MTNTINDNAHSNAILAAEHAARAASTALLPVLLGLLPLAVVTAAVEFVTELVTMLGDAPERAGDRLDRFEAEAPPTVRAVAEVVCVCVLGRDPASASDGVGECGWSVVVLARALAALHVACEAVTGLRPGERDPGVPATDVTSLDVRERALDGARRAVVRAVVATIPHGERAEVLGHVAAWETVLGGLARAAANTTAPSVLAACDTAGWEAACVFENATRPHHFAVTALSSLWHGASPSGTVATLAAPEPSTRTTLVDGCDTAAADLAHVRALFTAAA